MQQESGAAVERGTQGRLGFVGGGNMAWALGGAVLRSGLYSPENVWVSGPRLHNLKNWADAGVHVTTKNADIVNCCDIIFLGVKPQVLLTAIGECEGLVAREQVGAEKLFVSMLAGVTIAHLSKVVKVLGVDARIIRIMPNTPVQVGAGACLYAPAPGVAETHCDALAAMLAECGLCERVPEAMMDSLGALSGCGPAFMYIVMEGLADGAVKQGVPRHLATKFAAQMVLGSARMVLESGKHPAVLKDEVCSPGGSTICGVAALENGRIRATLINAIEASVNRNKELGIQK